MNQFKTGLISSLLYLITFGGLTIQAQTNTGPNAPDKPAADVRTDQPNVSNTYTPLTGEEKIKFGLRQAYFQPGSYIGPAFGAFFTTRREEKAFGKTGQDRFADGLSYYARSFATSSTAELLGNGVYPVLFKQDPRYFPSPERKFKSRLLYAISRPVLTRGDNGRSQINFSKLAGNLTAAGLANIYERDVVRSRDAQGRPVEFRRRVGVGPTFIKFAQSTAFDALGYAVFNEFDLIGKLGKKTRKVFGK